MELETMRPNPAWDPAAYEDAVGTFERLAGEIEVRVWGGDWCKDCRAQLPDFGAALEAAGVSDERVHHYPVEKRDDGSKSGELVEQYGIELIPTVVIERDGEELARFVEEAGEPIVVHLAAQLETATAV